LKIKLTDLLKSKDFTSAFRLFDLMKVEFASDPLFSVTQANETNDVDEDMESIQIKIDIVIDKLKSVFFGELFEYLAETDVLYDFLDNSNRFLSFAFLKSLFSS